MQYNVLLATLSNIAHIHFPWYPDQTLTQKKLHRRLCEVASWAPRPLARTPVDNCQFGAGVAHNTRGHNQQPNEATTHLDVVTTNNNIWPQPTTKLAQNQNQLPQGHNQQPYNARTNNETRPEPTKNMATTPHHIWLWLQPTTTYGHSQNQLPQGHNQQPYDARTNYPNDARTNNKHGHNQQPRITPGCALFRPSDF